MVPADFFLFPHVKEALARHTLTASVIKTALDGVTAGKEAFSAAFRNWYERCLKCVEQEGDYVENS